MKSRRRCIESSVMQKVKCGTHAQNKLSTIYLSLLIVNRFVICKMVI